MTDPSRRWRPPLSVVLSLGFGVLIALAMGALMLVAMGAARDSTEDLLRVSADLVLTGLIARVSEHMKTAEDQARFVAQAIRERRLQPDDPEMTYAFLHGSLAAAPQVSGIAFLESNGSGLGVGRFTGEFGRRAIPWREDPDLSSLVVMARQRDSLTWNGVIWVEALGEPQVQLVLPVFRDEAFLGVVVGVVSIRELSHYLAELNDEHDARAFILRGRDEIVAHPALIGALAGLGPTNPLPKLGDIGDGVMPHVWDLQEDRISGIFAKADLEGHLIQAGTGKHLVLYRESEGFGVRPWTFGLHIPVERLSPALARLRDAAIIGAALVLGTLIVAFVLGRGIARPIRRLAQSARAIRTLDLTQAKPLGQSLFRETDEAGRAFDAMLVGLRRFETYVPRLLVLRLMRLGDQSLRSEEREVTVLFTDIVGFTGLSEQLDAVSLAAVLNRHFALLSQAIEAEGGTLDKYIGDSVMAFWGAPEAQPDHARRACRAALAMAAALRAEADNRDGGPLLRVRIGIHTGSVVVGNIGAPGRVNYTAIGDAVNTAQRLENLGKAHDHGAIATVLISGAVQAQLGDDMPAVFVGKEILRGRATATAVFRLAAKSDAGQNSS